MTTSCRAAAFVLVLWASAAHAAQSTLAVMPLRDLAGGRPSVGAAFRETLTTDLGHVPNLKVVEREMIDRVLKEQAVDPAKVLEGVLGVRVGTLLGASHLVLGAYQREGERLRVTARVIDVATGVVVGSTKVDGTMDHLLDLQDKLSSTLLATVGWKGPPQPARVRPKLASRAIERFGDAILEPDQAKKKVLLAESIQASPQFSYAVDALASLEGRLGTYEQAQASTMSEREKNLLAAATNAKSPAATRAEKLNELANGARSARRYHALLAACDAVKLPEAKEALAYNRFVALIGLRRIDEGLAAGEAFLHDFPGSTHFGEVENKVREVADVRRVEHERKKDYDQDLAKELASKDAFDRDWGPCIAARWNRQINQLMVDGCKGFIAKASASPDSRAKDNVKNAYLFVILGLGQTGHFDEARQRIADYRKRYPEGDKEIDDALAIWPTD